MVPVITKAANIDVVSAADKVPGKNENFNHFEMAQICGLNLGGVMQDSS